MILFSRYLEKLNNHDEECAVIYGDENKLYSKSYKEINGMIVSIIDKIGLAAEQERIGIVIDNNVHYLTSFLASVYCGYTVVGINPRAIYEEKKQIIDENEIKKILTTSEYKDEYKDTGIFVDEIEEQAGYIAAVERMDTGACIISYTSGTSGNRSKGVILTNHNILSVSKQYQKIYGTSDSDNIMTFLPCWHNYGMIACLCNALYSCCKISIIKKWNIEAFGKVMREYKPTVFPGSPYMYIDIIANKDVLKNIEFDSLRICDSGGDSLPIGCINDFEKLSGAVITEGYGLTETSSLTHFNRSASQRRIGSIGNAVDGIECQIRDIDGNILGENEWGLLWIRGDMVFDGYIDSSLNEAVFDSDGWFNTKDIVRVDDQGYYFIAGRLSDLKVISKDVEINRKIENSLFQSQMVEKLFIKTNHSEGLCLNSYELYIKGNAKFNELEMYDYISKNLYNIAIDKVNFVDEIELTDTGKVKREKIRG